MNADNLVLVVSAGQTDLQLPLRNEQGELYRTTFKTVRAFHQDLLDGALPYRFAPEYAMLPEAPGDVALEWFGGQACFENNSPYEIALDPASEQIPLIPAKLQPLVESLRAKGTVTGVILLNTHRTTPWRGQNAFEREPIAAGPLLARWVAEELGLEYGGEAGCIGPGIAGWIDFLDGDMALEDPGPDRAVNRLAAARIDAALASAASWPGVDAACLALGGGLPPLKAPILASASFRFPKVFDMRIPQYGQAPEWNPVTRPRPSVAQSFHTRGLVRDAIQRGDFLGAEALSRPFAGDPNEAAWVIPVASTARYFAGTLDKRDDLPDYIQTLLDPKQPEALSVAMRAESALAADRIQDAIALTFTFADTALVDGIRQLFSPDCRFLPLMKQIRCPRDELAPALEALLSPLENDHKGKPTLNRFSPDQYPGSYQFNIEGPHIERWKSRFPAELAVALNQFDELNREPCDVRGLRDTRFLIPRFVRNALAHNTLTTKELHAAQQVFRKIAYWSSKDHPNQGEHFLAQPLIRAILQALGVQNPAEHYRSLVQGLTQAIENHPLA